MCVCCCVVPWLQAATPPCSPCTNLPASPRPAVQATASAINGGVAVADALATALAIGGGFSTAYASALAQAFGSNTAPLCSALAQAQATAIAAQGGFASAAADAFAACT